MIELDVVNKILVHLDGWALSDDKTEIIDTIDEKLPDELSDEEIDELFDGTNKRLKLSDVDRIYTSSLNYAQNYTKRLLISFDDVNKELFLNAVYVLTASNLFGKYNIKVNNNQEEDTTPQSRAGVLYSQAIKQLNSHKITTVKTRKSIKDQKGS